MNFDKTNLSDLEIAKAGDEREGSLSTKRIERVMRIDFLSGSRLQIQKEPFLIERKNGFLQNESTRRSPLTLTLSLQGREDVWIASGVPFE